MLAKMISFFLGILVISFSLEAQPSLVSPDGKLKVIVETNKQLTYAVYYNGIPIVLASSADMILAGDISLSNDLRIKKVSSVSVNDSIYAPVPEKRRWVKDVYQQLTIEFREPFSIIFRAYNDGVAYRFTTRFRDSIVIKQELAHFNFPKAGKLYFPKVEKRQNVDSFHTSFESNYQFRSLDSIYNSSLFFTPVLLVPSYGPKILLTESDIEDYPGMFLRGTGSGAVEGCFAAFPIEETITNEAYPQSIVTKRGDYIAKTKGTRVYPWRVLAVASKDADLPGNDIVYRLAAPSRLKDVSWVKPGKGTDEWIIGINLFNIPFTSGINTATYKYYIDFARQFGFDRIMMDAGWSDYRDLFKINPHLDMEELSRYAKAKNIKISMWTLAVTLDRQLDSALGQFKKWGVDFIMTDFMDRDDQKMVQFYYRIAEACARKQIMIMFHGAYKPAGFNRTYPNAITRESVLGSEYNIWSNKADPDHDLLLPYIRMVSGPMDYEPGLLDNATREQFRPVSEKVMSQGTRCHQLAMFVVYDSPMQLFSGNPSQGLLEPAFMQIVGNIPTTWDETEIMAGEVGEYIVTARKKGNDWYLAGMTNWNKRDLSIGLDFLGDGDYKYEVCADGVNANRYAADYAITNGVINKKQLLSFTMAPGGGYFIHFKKMR